MKIYKLKLTGGDITIRSSDSFRRSGKITIDNQLGEPKIGDVRLEIQSDQDVIALDIPVNDWRDTIMVQVGESLGCSKHDPIPQVPFQAVTASLVQKTA